MREESNIFVLVFNQIKDFAKANKKSFLKCLVISTAIGFISQLFLIQLYCNVVSLLQHKEQAIIISRLLKIYFERFVIFFPLTLVITLVVFYCFVMFKKISRFKGEYDSERDLTRLTDGTVGTGKLLTNEEDVKTVFDVGYYGDYKSNIFGCLDGKYDGNSSMETKAGEILVYEHDANIQDNMNLFGVGRAGTGKTRKWVVNNILQMLDRGDSVICTDTKGDLVRLLYRYAHDVLKIPTKIINFKPDELIYSDAIDIFGVIGDYSKIKLIKDANERQTAINIAKAKCEEIAECIRYNLSEKAPNKGADFWDLEGRNYIRFWVCYYFFNEAIPKSQKNFYDMAQHMSRLKIREKEGEQVPEGYTGFVDDLLIEVSQSNILNQTCGYALRTMLGGTLTVRNSCHAGLQITLSALTNPLIRKITSNDEVDLSLPAKQQCMYFLVMHPTNRDYQFLVSTVLTLLYQKMISYIDSKLENHMADVPVWMVYDEFTNIGKVPNIATQLATVRDQLIRHALFIQSFALARTVYTEEEFEAIKSNCAYWELFGSTEDEVLQLFSDISGIMGVEANSERKTESKMRFLNLHMNVQSTRQATARNVMNKDEIGRLKAYELLVYKNGEQVARLHTWDYTNHPIWKNKCQKYATSLHVPLWRMKEAIETSEREKREREAYAGII